ncbi:MAG: FAD binding domain-containing protein [Albidovulum sp.]
MAILRPDNLVDALAQRATVRAAEPMAVLAGGTDFFPTLGKRQPPARVLDLSGIAELARIERQADGWRIGAAVTWAGLIATPLPAVFDGLKEVARQVGSVQIQNTATLAGNICNASPAADGVPMLLALGARVEVASAKGRRALDLRDFITGVRKTALAGDEIVTALLIPDHEGRARTAFEKLGSREYLVISIAMVAVMLVPEAGKIGKAAVAVGACSPVACRLPGLEAALIGHDLRADPGALVCPDHLTQLTPVSDVRGSADYRRQAVLVLLRRALLRAAEGIRDE